MLFFNPYQEEKAWKNDYMMKIRLPVLFQCAALLLICACKKDNNGLQEPGLLWQRPYLSDTAPELVYADNQRLHSFANSPDGGLFAHDKSTGDIAWKTGTGQFQGLVQTEFFTDGVFVLHSYDVGNHFYGVDLQTGQKLWEKYFPGTGLYSIIGHFGNTVFFDTNNGQPLQQFNGKSGDIRPLPAFSYPFAWESRSEICGRVNAAGDTILYQICYGASHDPQIFLSAWNLSTGSLWKEIPLAPQPSWHREKLLFEAGGKFLFARDAGGISSFDAETLDAGWSVTDNTGELLLTAGLLFHKKTDSGFAGEVDVLDAASGAIQFSFETKATSLSNKVARLGAVVYHYEDPLYGIFGLETYAGLKAFQIAGGDLRWDKQLAANEGGEDSGVIYCDAGEKAVFVLTANSLFRYNPVK